MTSTTGVPLSSVSKDEGSQGQGVSMAMTWHSGSGAEAPQTTCFKTPAANKGDFNKENIDLTSGNLLFLSLLLSLHSNDKNLLLNVGGEGISSSGDFTPVIRGSF